MSSATSPNVDVDSLRSALKGQVFTPEDAGHDEAQRLFVSVYDSVRPSVIAQVAEAGDVATVLSAAREAGLPLAIRSGGHSAAGHSTSDGGIVIDVRALMSLEIDLESKTDRGLMADSSLGALISESGAEGI